ncbi:hypothetical protein [Terrimonas pollutisoli]|uniref:hypothetical protein n=1 Tax=Terrimonas pollutisoli TaxID=3034147 RepID=UPI0023EABC8B|nr:hypothetical protein [Terrimonas sp. H1YJ31]
MKKFVVLYHAPFGAMQETANMEPEDQVKGMEAWRQWANQCGDKLIDLGSPLMNGQELLPNGQAISSNRNVAGYSILQANDMNEAKSLLIGHPHLQWNTGASIEIHESMPLPGM